MNVLPSALLAVALVVAIYPLTAAAQSFRCKNDLISVGDSKASALLKCGEPVVKDSFCKPAYTADSGRPQTTTVVPCENVDEWTYNPGYGQLMTTLRFEAGKLKSIKYGDRVK